MSKIQINSNILKKACENLGVDYSKHFKVEKKQNAFEKSLTPKPLGGSNKKAKSTLKEKQGEFVVLLKSLNLDPEDLLQTSELVNNLEKAKKLTSEVSKMKELIKGQSDTIGELRKKNETLSKGLLDVTETIKTIAQQPIRKQNTVVSSAILKSGGEGKREIQKGEQVFSLSRNKREVLNILGMKVDEELESGSANGKFAKASTLYEAGNKTLPIEITQALEKEHIFFIQ